MTSPFWKPNWKPNLSRTISLRRLIPLVLWIGVGIVLSPVVSWVVSEPGRLRGNANFEAAYNFVYQIEQSASSQTSRASDRTNYGITQADYDYWRQKQGKPTQNLDSITLDEVKAIYKVVWQQGQCGKYAPPLDVACLDSLLSFGEDQAKQFFTDLPTEPKQATIVVAQHRQTYRQQVVAQQSTQSNSSGDSGRGYANPGYGAAPTVPGGGYRVPPYAPRPYPANPYSPPYFQNPGGGFAMPPYAPGIRPYLRNMPGAGFSNSPYAPSAEPSPRPTVQLEQWLQEGLKRDRALAAYAEAYPRSREANSEFNPSRLFGSGASSSLPDTASSADSSSSASSDKAASPSSSPAASPSPVAKAIPQPLTSDQIYAKAKPYTVEVWLQELDGTSAPAAGIILTPDGLVLTNYHVISSDASQSSTFPIRLIDGRELKGTVINSDRGLDLALIQLKDAKSLPTAPLADDSAHVQVGDTVYAVGSPEGTHWKLTTAQVIETESACGAPELRCIRTPAGFLRPGNSGGPLLDKTGKVVGINRAIQESTGEGVSIPVEIIKKFSGQ